VGYGKKPKRMSRKELLKRGKLSNRKDFDAGYRALFEVDATKLRPRRITFSVSTSPMFIPQSQNT